MGRPSKIDQLHHIAQNDERITTGQQVIALVSEGHYFEDACRASGINPGTGHEWKQRGWDAIAQAAEHEADIPEREQPFAKFADALEKARGQAAVTALHIVLQAARGLPGILATDDEGQLIRDAKGNPVTLLPGAPGQWQAAAWFLERTRRNQFGRQVDIGAKGKDGERLSIADLIGVASADED